MRKSIFHEHYGVLRSMGFFRESTTREVVVYMRGEPSMAIWLDVQFWHDTASGRVSHGHRGRQNTRPIEFVTMSEMVMAIRSQEHCDGQH